MSGHRLLAVVGPTRSPAAVPPQNMLTPALPVFWILGLVEASQIGNSLQGSAKLAWAFGVHSSYDHVSV